MPRTKTTQGRTNYRAIAAASIERELNWKQLVEQMEGRVGELETERDALRSLYNRRGDELVATHETATRLRRQLEHLRTTYDALSQRYAGVKLDTQQFNFGQAQQWLGNEGKAVIDALVRIQGEVGREFARSRSAEQAMSSIGDEDLSNTALGARGAISRRKWVSMAWDGDCEPDPEFAEVDA